MIYLGIDPGRSGAICAVGDCGSPYDSVRWSSPLSEVSEWLGDMKARAPLRAAIEKVGAMPKQGLSSTFKFGEAYGWCGAMLTAHRISHEYVVPTSWQREFGLVLRRSKGAPKETSTAKKNRHKARAKQLFPDVKVTHATADAWLIAEWCRREHARRMPQAVSA